MFAPLRPALRAARGRLALLGSSGTSPAGGSPLPARRGRGETRPRSSSRDRRPPSLLVRRRTIRPWPQGSSLRRAPSSTRWASLFFVAHDHDGAVGVPYHGIGDAAHKGAPYPLAPPAAHHYQ